MKHRLLMIFVALLVLAPRTVSSADEPVFVDPDTARWQVGHVDGTVDTFYFGLPGDIPMSGDWDCDGIDSAGMWRPSTGFMYLQDDATGVAQERLFLGEAGTCRCRATGTVTGATPSASTTRPRRGVAHQRSRPGFRRLLLLWHPR